MVFHILEILKNKASHIAYNNFFYNWGLYENVPDRLVVRPVDPWKGNPDSARELLDAAGIGARTGAKWCKQWWFPCDSDNIWVDHMHGFGWLRDLRALDGALAREQGRVMIESWIDNYGSWEARSWKADLIGRRLSMWICHYEFFCANIDEKFEEKILHSIIQQAKYLSNILDKSKNVTSFEAIKGLLSAAIAIDGHEKWIRQALDTLKQQINIQIYLDGGHISRSPATLLKVLEIMVEIRIALKAGGYTVPEFLSDTIDNMSCALRMLRYNDRKLAVFHGSQEGNQDDISSIIAQAGTYKKPCHSLKNMGFERLELGRSMLLMDVGNNINQEYEKNIHASTLAFEFCYGRDRLFVSCGSHPVSEQWQDALRATAAHNTVCLDYRNSFEIRKDGKLGRKVNKVKINRRDTKETSLIIASHDGYISLNGITHTRKIYLSNEGNNLYGEDKFLCCDKSLFTSDIEAAIRFHLHPSVSSSLINNGREILLRMRGGIGWRFSCSDENIALEDSLYIGNGSTPRKTKQIVIYKIINEERAVVKWSLKREI